MGRFRRSAGQAKVPRLAAGAVIISALVSGCGLFGGPTTFHEDTPDVITVTSPVLAKDVLPAQYTCRGGGTSPAINWSGPLPGTRSWALVLDDSDTPITPHVYWIVFDINPDTTDIQAGQLPPGAREAQNSDGEARYGPPCPQGRSHTYRFTVYALRSSLALPNGTSLESAWTAIAGAAIGWGRLGAVARP